MPRIDDPKLKRKAFKKENYRAFSKNLRSELLMDSDEPSDEKDTKGVKEPPVREKKEQASNSTAVNTENLQQLDTKENTKVQLGFNQGSIRVQKPEKNKIEPRSTSTNLLSDEQDINNRIGKLSGLEQKVFFLVHDICIDRKDVNTGHIKSINFDRAIGANRNSRETAVKRLVKKGLLQRNKGKSGADGTLNFSISEIIMSEALRFVSNQGKYEVFGNKVDKSYPDYKRNVKQEEEALVD